MKIDNKKHIHPRVENKLLDEDEDAVVATIVASMDFYKETKNEEGKIIKYTKRQKYGK